MTPITLTHISDLHFHALPKTLSEWASKRFLGASNLILRRRKHYPIARARALVSHLQSLSADHLVISGDLTSLALESEFAMARAMCEPLLSQRNHVTIIPGNHDRYTNDIQGTTAFESFFGDFFLGETPKPQSPIKTVSLGNSWHLIAWDSTHPNPWFVASGTVSIETLRATEAYIQSHPEGRFVITNHYPSCFPQDHLPHRSHELHNLSHIQSWLKQQTAVQVYLHGHVHHNWHHVVHRPEGPSLHCVNSASSTHFPSKGASSFHQVILRGDEVDVMPHQF